MTYVYCVALLVIAAASNSESAWDIYRIPLQTVNGWSNTNRQSDFYYPSNGVGNTRKGFNDYFNYEDFNRESQNYDDFSNEWSRNSGLVRTERQQLFPQNPVQTASDVNVCIRNCPTTSEYNPVCGTNGVTYTNPSRLECAKFCGVAVQISRYSRCPEPGLLSTDVSTPPPSIPTITPVRPTPVSPTPASPTPASPTPVRPTPVRPTPVSPTPVNSTPARPTPVTPSPAPPSPVTNPPTQSTTPSGLDFTVPQDILDNIFTTNYGTLIDERHEDD